MNLKQFFKKDSAVNSKPTVQRTSRRRANIATRNRTTNHEAVSGPVGDIKAKVFAELSAKNNYMQGIETCPVCGGQVNYIWAGIGGFTQMECIDCDCFERMAVLE